jgi:hypothetical protein
VPQSVPQPVPPLIVSAPPVSTPPVSAAVPVAAAGYPVRGHDPVRLATFVVLALVLLATAVLVGLLAG